MNAATADLVLKILADGHFHSGERLAGILGVSRSAVWKSVKRLEDWGLNVQAVRGRGYRLEAPIDLLEVDSIQRGLSSGIRARLERLDVLSSVDSTNGYLRRQSSSGLAACLAESQSAGRGRRGRAWHSPFARNIYLSLAGTLEASIESLAGLSLAMGVAVHEALATLGMTGAGLKWPNDVYWQNRKLAGILIEVDAESSGRNRVIIGVGLNVDMSGDKAPVIDQPWVDLSTIWQGLSGSFPGRNDIAVKLLDSLVGYLDRFEAEGFQDIRHEWQRHDLARGRRVAVITHNRTITGIGRGVDTSGGFLLQHEGGIEVYQSGEVSLRL